MKRRGKIIATITTMCLAFAMLVVGVLAAQTVSMEIGGTVTYKVEDAMCNFTTSLFCADNNTLVTDAGLYNEMVKLTDTTLDINDESVTLPTNIVRSGRFATVSKSSYDIQTSTFNSELDVDGLDLVLGKYDSSEEETSRKSYSYYIVIEIENLADNKVNVSVAPDISNVTPENVRNILINEKITVGARETKRVVIGYSLQTLTKAVSDTDFNYVVEAKNLYDPQLELETFHKSSTLQDLSLENQTFTCTTQAGTLAGGSALVSFSVEDIPEGYNNLQLMISDSNNTTYSDESIGMYVNSKEELPANLEEAGTLLGSLSDYSKAIFASSFNNIYLEDSNVYFFIMLSGFDTSLTEVAITAQKTLMSLESKITKSSAVTIEDCFVDSLMGMPMVLVNCTITDIKADSMLVDIPSVMGISGAIMLEEQNHPDSLGQAFPMLMSSEIVFDGETSVVVPLTSKYADNSLKFAFAVIGMFTEASVDISLTASYGEIEAESEYTYELQTINEKQGYVITDYNGSDTNVVVPSYFVDEDTNTAYDVIGVGGFRGNIQSIVLPDTLLSISNYAFSGCNQLSSITIPDSVTSIGANAFKGCKLLTSVTIPDSVTSIGECAFYSCSGLTGELIIPDSVTSIGNSAFYHCTGLTSVTIPDSVTSIGEYAFYWCTGLTSVTIPDTVTSIGEYAFYWCKGLTSVTIPDSVSTIGNYAFNYCTGLTSVTIGDSVTSIGDFAFYYCKGLTSVTIPDSVETIGDSAFSHCTGLTSVIMGNSVTSIGGDAFSHCTGLTSVNIPDSVTSIGDFAFWYCTGLTSVNIPDSVTSIGERAFYDCTGLTSVIMGNSVSTIGDGAFYSCDVLENISVGDNIEKIGQIVFEYTKYYDTSSNWQNGLLYLTSRGNKKYLIDAKSSLSGEFNLSADVQAVSDGVLSKTSLTNITVDENNPRYTSKIGEVETNSIIRVGEDNTTYTLVTGISSSVLVEGITAIGDYAFYSCSGLTGNLVIPNSVTSIGNSAFSDCTGLTSVTIPDSVTSIGNNAFDGCNQLSSITIPDSVTSIENHAFSFCTGLTSVTIPDSVTSIGGHAFHNCTGLTSVTIPDSVTSIGDSAFYGWTEEQSIYFIGTMPENLESHWKNQCNAKIYLNGEEWTGA